MMIRLWPWTKFDQLEKQVLWAQEQSASRLASLETRQVWLSQAWRDLAATNKGIRRLKAKLAKYESQRPHDYGGAAMSMLTIDDLTQFRKLATKKRTRVRTSCGELVEVYSALEMCLDHIADAGKMVKDQEAQQGHASRHD